MKRVILIGVFLLLIFVILLIVKFYFGSIINKESSETQNLQKTNMKITSPAFQDNSNLPVQYSCDGRGINPPLVISDVPQNTKSFVLFVEDPDAPSGTFTHWVVYDINPSVREIQENSTSKGAYEGKTSIGNAGYVAPCPPSGAHHYVFKLFALDTMLNLKSAPRRSEIEKAMTGHIIDQAQIIGLYWRK
ncbi:MAG: YbhB/YbcL family Raf kinase inhibitor-like protein [Patescibacteria group bacterium]|nr:YbhB/YbcL family Raf kinase inhibitor-like protein [Patescibacteria group bacterium]